VAGQACLGKVVVEKAPILLHSLRVVGEQGGSCKCPIQSLSLLCTHARLRLFNENLVTTHQALALTFVRHNPDFHVERMRLGSAFPTAPRGGGGGWWLWLQVLGWALPSTSRLQAVLLLNPPSDSLIHEMGLAHGQTSEAVASVWLTCVWIRATLTRSHYSL
jgi:hypothetical protein